jgi:hypothetical protein
MDGAPLDTTDIIELAELLDFTADALSWRAANAVYPDLAAHLRRWARRLGPGTPGWTWSTPPATPTPADSAPRPPVPEPDADPPDRTDDPGDGIDQPEPPSCHDTVTMRCPVCQHSFVPVGRQQYCGDPCRAAAYRRRRDAHHTPVVIPKARPRRPITVYECDNCGERALGEQRCEPCSTFMRRIGVGGCCPACDAPIATQELVDQEVIA